MRRGWIVPALVPVLLLVLSPPAARSDTPAWKNYPHRAGILTFPEDEGIHTTDSLEWWYMNGHLIGAQTGRPYAVIAAAFKPLAIVPHNLICNIIEKPWNGTAGAYHGHFAPDLVLETRPGYWNLFSEGLEAVSYWQQVDGHPFRYELNMQAGDGKLHLVMDARKPPIPLGGTGRVQQLEGTVTYYYALTRCALSGSVTLGALTEPVHGFGWVDRQWYESNTLLSLAYEWFSMQLTLSNGDEVEAEFYWLLDLEGNVPYPLLDVIFADGTYEAAWQICLEHLSFWTRPGTRLTYPRTWRVRGNPPGALPPHLDPHPALDVTFTTDMENQLAESPLGKIYEGSYHVITEPPDISRCLGLDVAHGAGFAEMLVNPFLQEMSEVDWPSCPQPPAPPRSGGHR